MRSDNWGCGRLVWDESRRARVFNQESQAEKERLAQSSVTPHHIKARAVGAAAKEHPYRPVRAFRGFEFSSQRAAHLAKGLELVQS